MSEIEFDVDKLEKINFEDWERMLDEKNPINRWIDNLFNGGLFGYAPHYSLTHPHVLFMDFMRKIKWAYQRVYRGWDDRVSWSIDYWLNEIMPDILRRLSKTKHGVPIEFFGELTPDKHGNHTEEQYEQARQLWDDELNKMINAFEASKKMEDVLDKEEYELLELVFEEGMKSFVKWYKNLWD